MATPIENLQMLQGLFMPVAEQFNRQNDQRTALMLQLKLKEREDALKRQLADDQNRRYIELENLRATNSQALEDKRGLREDARLTALQTKQTADLDAREARALQAEFAKWYPQYAAAAARAGQKVNQLTDYEKTAEGLGQLQADLKNAEVGFENKRLAGAADAIMSEYEDGRKAVEAERARFEALGQPSDEDRKFARTRAVAALKKSIEREEIESVKKLSKKAVADGLAALSKGEETVAQNLLGDEALGAFQSAIEQTLMALPNTKSRLQERAQSQQRLLALQSQTSRIESDVRKAAAVNPFLAEQFKAKSPLTELMTSPAPRSSRTFDQITPPPASAQPAPGASGQPTTQTSAPPYKYPALSVLGMAERAPSASEFAMAPANLVAAPGRLIGEVARVGGAGLRGLYSGDYGLRPNPITTIGENVGEAIAAEPVQAAPGTSAMQANLLRTLMTPSPVVPPSPKRSLFGADNPGRQADIDRQAALIEWLLSNGQN